MPIEIKQIGLACAFLTLKKDSSLAANVDLIDDNSIMDHLRSYNILLAQAVLILLKPLV